MTTFPPPYTLNLSANRDSRDGQLGMGIFSAATILTAWITRMSSCRDLVGSSSRKRGGSNDIQLCYDFLRDKRFS